MLILSNSCFQLFGKQAYQIQHSQKKTCFFTCAVMYHVSRSKVKRSGHRGSDESLCMIQYQR